MASFALNALTFMRPLISRNVHFSCRRFHQSSKIQRTTQTFPLQADVDKDAPAITGYNRILHRMANIVLNITEKQPTKILHVFPTTTMLRYLGRENHSFDISGLANHSSTTNTEAVAPVNKLSYSHLDFVPQLSNLDRVDYSSNSFQLIAHCAPVNLSSHSLSSLVDPEDAPSDGKKSSLSDNKDESEVTLLSPLGLQVSELLRILNSRGFLIIGYPEGLWNTLSYTQLLTDMSSWGESEEFIGELLTIQKVFIPVDELTSVSTAAGQTDLTTTTAPEDELLAYDNEIITIQGRDNISSPPIIKYVIGVFRKK